MKQVKFFLLYPILSPVFLVVSLVGVVMGAWEVRHGLLKLAKEKFNNNK